MKMQSLRLKIRLNFRQRKEERKLPDRGGGGRQGETGGGCNIRVRGEKMIEYKERQEEGEKGREKMRGKGGRENSEGEERKEVRDVCHGDTRKEKIKSRRKLVVNHLNIFGDQVAKCYILMIICGKIITLLRLNKKLVYFFVNNKCIK